MYSVMICDSASPPTTAMPSGRRDSDPMPVAIATGSVPTSAAIVVIMIGRKRMCAACTIDSRRRPMLGPFDLEREVDHHDRVLLHDADEKNDADEREHAELHVEDVQREQRAERGEGQARENRERVDEALVENAEHHVDHADGEDDENEQPGLRRLKRLRRSGERRRDPARQILRREALHLRGRRAERRVRRRG